MRKSGKLILSLALATGLSVAPGLAHKSCAQPPFPSGEVLNNLAQGQKQARPAPTVKSAPNATQGAPTVSQIEEAARQNMQSAEVLLGAAAAAGASPQQLEAMEKASVRFMKLFLNVIAPDEGINADRPKGDKPKKDGNKRKADRDGKKGPAPQNGMILTGPDGSQWLVTPFTPEKRAPKPPRDVRPAPQRGMTPPPPPGARGPVMTPPPGCPAFQGPGARAPMTPPPGAPAFKGQTPPPLPNFVAPNGRMTPAPQNTAPAPQFNQPQGAAPAPLIIVPQAPQVAPQVPQVAPQAPQAAPQAPVAPQRQPEVIIMEETVTDMPLWPTKEQVAKDGVLQYLEKRNAQRQSATN